MFVRSLLSLAAVSLAMAVSAQVYTWKDENGRTHFSDQPPPGVNAKQAGVSKGPKYLPPPVDAKAGQSTPAAQSGPAATQSGPASAQSGPKTWQDKDAEYKQRKAAEQAAAAKQKDEADKAAELKRYCEGLRNNIAMMEGNGRVSRPNANGEPVMLSDADKKQSADTYRQQLARDCK